MAKNRNKGFTLIEVIIAIALMTLLITPIVKQLANSMSINKRSKEEQHALEDATRVLEHVQRTSVDDLADTDDTLDIYCKATASIPDAPNVTCAVYSYDPVSKAVSATPIGTIDYTAYDYPLNDFTSGATHTTYNRYVVLDDLSNRIMATDFGGKSYRVQYSLENGDYNLDGSMGVDLTRTSEGSLVHYDANKHIDAIVCTEVGDFADKEVLDPNEVNLGNIHNLDYSQVALINGYGNDNDVQAERDLYTQAMRRLKIVDYPKWLNQINGSNEGVLSQYGYTNGLKKCTKIYIGEEAEYYEIIVDVYFENILATTISKPADSDEDISDEEIAELNKNDKLAYPVFSQRFYKKSETYPDGVESCPEIYFEYQPFAISDDGVSVTYASNEYIMIDNYVEDVNIYLYKPAKDRLYIVENGLTSSSDVVNDGSDAYTTYSGTTTKVNVNIVNLNKNNEAAVPKANIFTNINTFDSDGKLLTSNSQFTCGTDAVSNFGTGPSRVFGYVESNSTILGTSTLYAFDADNIKPLSEDSRVIKRLFTVTVYLEPVDSPKSNEVILTGAKGEN